jgi:predicted  nucleic acid-binding Zn-ribbon protein
MIIMEAVTTYVDRKTELETKIQSFEAEKSSLLAAISVLKEKVATLELERAASSLESEVESLKSEKAALEEKVAEYTSAPYEGQPPTAEGFQA